MFGSLLAGLALTPALEYAWHAFVAHGTREDPTRTSHLDHHRTANIAKDPWEEMGENAARLAKTLLAVNVGVGALFGLRRSLPLSAGLLAGYAFTTLYHAQMHERAPRTAYERWMWRFHWHHHAADFGVNFGLTNPVFDFVFGSAVVPDRVEVPERIAPVWLHEETAGIAIRARTPRAQS